MVLILSVIEIIVCHHPSFTAKTFNSKTMTNLTFSLNFYVSKFVNHNFVNSRTDLEMSQKIGACVLDVESSIVISSKA